MATYFVRLAGGWKWDTERWANQVLARRGWAEESRGLGLRLKNSAMQLSLTITPDERFRVADKGRDNLGRLY